MQYKNNQWTKYPPITINFLRAIAMVDENNGWIVGDNGTILKCSNGIWNRYEQNLTLWKSQDVSIIDNNLRILCWRWRPNS